MASLPPRQTAYTCHIRVYARPPLLADAAVQAVLAYWNPESVPAEPPAPAVTAYGAVQMSQSASLWDNRAVFGPAISTPSSTTPPAFEALNISRGLAL